jgi:hypothetical protein
MDALITYAPVFQQLRRLTGETMNMNAPNLPATKSREEQRRLNQLAEGLAFLSRMVRNFAEANDRSEPVMAGCVKSAIPAAQKALSVLVREFGDGNAADTPRFTGDHYATEATAAGGTLVIRGGSQTAAAISVGSSDAEAIETARRLLASGKLPTATHGRMQTELGLYEQADRIIKTDEVAGLTNGRTIQYQRNCALAWLRRAVRESE